MGTKPGKLTDWFIALAAVAAMVSGAVALDRILDESSPPAAEPPATTSFPVGPDDRPPRTTGERSASESSPSAAGRDVRRDPVPTPFGANRRVDDSTVSRTPSTGSGGGPGISIVIEEGGLIDEVADGVEISRASD